MDCSMPGLPPSPTPRNLLQLMSMESVMPSKHLNLGYPLLFPSRFVSRTEFFSPGATGISGLHSRLTRGVRPKLEGNEWTPLASRVATGILWSPRVA